MKKILITLFLLPFTVFAKFDSPHPSSILIFYDDDKFEYRSNVIYKKGSNSPYSGRVLTYSNSGEIRMSGFCKYGYPIDEWTIYKDTVIRKSVTESTQIRVKRKKSQANKIAKTRNCLVGYDWIDASRTAAFKFNSNGGFNFSMTSFGGGSKYGDWDVTDQDRIYLDYRGSGTNKTILMLTCKKLKVGSTVYYRSDSYNTSESWNASLEASMYFLKTQKRDTIKDVTESFKTHWIKFGDNGHIQRYKTYKDNKNNFEQRFNQNETLVFESTTDYTKEWYDNGIIKLERYPAEVLVNYSSKGIVESIYTMNSDWEKEGFCMDNNIYSYYKYNPNHRYNKSYGLKNDILKEWNDKGELVTDIKTNKKGEIYSGFFMVNKDKKIEISSTKYSRTGWEESFETYKVVETIFDDNNTKQYSLVWYGSKFFDRTQNSNSWRVIPKLIKIQEFYSNGKLKKEFNFSKANKAETLETKTNRNYGKLNDYYFVDDNLFVPSMKYPLFIGEQKTFYENGQLKCNVVFDNFTKIKKKKIDPKQKYIEYNYNAGMGISQDKIVYFSYLGEGRSYDKNGKKGDKVFWDQFGRICDKNGRILDDQILNVDINKFYNIWINALKK